MKKVITLSLFIALLCSSFTILQDPSKEIIGTWKIDDSNVDKATRSIIAITKKNNPAMASQMEENFDAMTQMIKGIQIEYKADNSYTATTPQGPQGGKWELADSGHSLLVTPQGRPQRKDSILALSASRLIIINRERGDTLLYVHP